jgi:light-regulated signal transduction histidine kinase (bacteriophytochrome)
MVSHSSLPRHDSALKLDECAREPIHIPGGIQPHGVLLALNGAGTAIAQASANAASLLGLPDGRVCGLALSDLFGDEQARALLEALADAGIEGSPLYVRHLTVVWADGVSERHFQAVVHRHRDLPIIELEPADGERDVSFQDLYPLVRSFVTRLRAARSLSEIATLAAGEVRRITGFDRVLVYQFDEGWNGHVIAESRSGDVPSYLDLWFPASDIPPQARELYRLSRLRLIPDAAYQAVPLEPQLHPETGAALDLSFSVLRSVSPVHAEYLRNMGVAASMSISLVTEGGQLWGLLACHHATPRLVPLEVRTACDFLSQALSVQIESRMQREQFSERLRLQSTVTRLLSYMAAEESFLDGLVRHPEAVLELVDAGGAAVYADGSVVRMGEAPPEAEVIRVVGWLMSEGHNELFASDAMTGYPCACGLLAIGLSRIHERYVLWFRKETERQVKWGGDPTQPAYVDPGDATRLHPRRSFEIWQETVRGHSLPWTETQLEIALELRNGILGIVLKQAEELAQLTADLQRSNRELEAFAHTVSHDLRSPIRHIATFAGMLRQSPSVTMGAGDLHALDSILKAAAFSSKLLDALLNFSRIDKVELESIEIDMNLLVEQVRADLLSECEGRQIHWAIDRLPRVHGDLVLIRLVWHNLIANALKYTRNRAGVEIGVTGRVEDQEAIYCVRDNGAGFDPLQQDRLFCAFQRLHPAREFEGTGLGLANVRRIVARHGGRTWAESRLGEGASFYFSLPVSAALGSGGDEAGTR